MRDRLPKPALTNGREDAVNVHLLRAGHKGLARLPVQDRPCSHPELPAARRPEVPGGTVWGAPGGGRHADTRAAQAPLASAQTSVSVWDGISGPDTAARWRGPGGLGPRPPAPQSPWVTAGREPARGGTTTAHQLSAHS